MALNKCPCGSNKEYRACCGRLHGGEPAANAEVLMRSRYSAYVQQNGHYLFATWHPRTRPRTLDFLEMPDEITFWLGLQIKAHRQINATYAEVEFVTRYRIGGGRAVRMRECSRFEYENGWLYVDGDVQQS